VLNENELRVELRCGENEGIEERERMYARAQGIADKFGIRTYFDRTWDHGTEYCDGYIYPTTANIIQVLDELEAAEVEFDNIDVQSRQLDLSFVKLLRERFPQGCSVSLNLGED
jgi:hypothetical protein